MGRPATEDFRRERRASPAGTERFQPAPRPGTRLLPDRLDTHRSGTGVFGHLSRRGKEYRDAGSAGVVNFAVPWAQTACRGDVFPGKGLRLTAPAEAAMNAPRRWLKSRSLLLGPLTGGLFWHAVPRKMAARALNSRTGIARVSKGPLINGVSNGHYRYPFSAQTQSP